MSHNNPYIKREKTDVPEGMDHYKSEFHRGPKVTDAEAKDAHDNVMELQGMVKDGLLELEKAGAKFSIFITRAGRPGLLFQTNTETELEMISVIEGITGSYTVIAEASAFANVFRDIAAYAQSGKRFIGELDTIAEAMGIKRHDPDSPEGKARIAELAERTERENETEEDRVAREVTEAALRKASGKDEKSSEA